MKRRYTIERASTPSAPRRFLAEQGGHLVWAKASFPIMVWRSPAAALWFAGARLGLARNDATIVAHTVH